MKRSADPRKIHITIIILSHGTQVKKLLSISNDSKNICFI